VVVLPPSIDKWRFYMRYWIKALGTTGALLEDDWTSVRGGILRKHATFGKRPIVEKGDRIVYYATGTGLVFAAGSVTSHPYENPTNSNDWPWRVNVDLEVQKQFIHDGSRLSELNTPTSKNDICSRIKRRSHVQLSREEFEAAVQALRTV
jgi:hypothetical protein